MIEKNSDAKIAYIHIQFPKLSETFIWREVAALKELGANISTYSLKPPFPSEINDENRRFVSETIYLPSDFSAAVIRSHIYWMTRKPIAYISVLWRLLASHYPPGNMWLAIRKPLVFWRAVHIAKMINDDKDVAHIHAHFKYVALLAWIVSRLTGHSYSFTSHFSTNSVMVGRIAEDAAFVTCVSEREKKVVKTALGQNKNVPIHVVRLGLPGDYFTETSARRGSDKSVIISVGRLIPKKGFDLLLKSCAIIKKRGLNFKLMIVGDGPLMNELKTQIRESGLEGGVELCGARDPVWIRGALDNADIFALFCAYGPDGDVDGIPVAMMEAMARRLPVVTTRVAALPELVEHLQNGFAIKPGDINAFADALEKLIRDSEFTKTMGDSAYQKVAREYRLDVEAASMKKLFDTLV